MNSPIPLGPFQLIAPLAKGGMGEVWRGFHPGQQIPVAVKVMTGKAAQNEQFRTSFRNEVRAMAGLNHPGVVLVFDYGEIDEQASQASEGALAPGSPYLVMDLASNGTLARIKKGLPWTRLKNTLISLLDVLAHAHARGVIHRDIKPGNVLIFSQTDLRPGLKLSDFGIAHALQADNKGAFQNQLAGTLHYMAPEQFKGS